MKIFYTSRSLKRGLFSRLKNYLANVAELAQMPEVWPYSHETNKKFNLLLTGLNFFIRIVAESIH